MKFFYRDMPTQCPLHIGKVSQKYLKEFLEFLPKQDLNNQGDNCRLESVRVVILECDMPTQSPLHIVEIS